MPLSQKENNCLAIAKQEMSDLLKKFDLRWSELDSTVSQIATGTFIGNSVSEKYSECLGLHANPGRPAGGTARSRP